MSIHSWMSILVGNQCSTRCEHCIWSAKPVQQQSIWWTLGRRQMCFEVPERNSISWNLVWTRWKLSVGEHVIFQECDFNDKIWRIVSSAQNSIQHQCQWSKWQVWWCNQCHWCWQWWRRQTRQPCRPERLHASLTLWETGPDSWRTRKMLLEDQCSRAANRVQCCHMVRKIWLSPEFWPNALNGQKMVRKSGPSQKIQLRTLRRKLI